MAGRWCKWCTMTEQWLYLHIEQRWVDEFADCWKQFEEYTDEIQVLSIVPSMGENK